MDENIARLGIAAIIGVTISISMIAMTVSRMVSSRRRNKELPDSSIARIEARLERMEQAIDAMATEVERVAEGQRFTSRLLADRSLERQS
jgi:hypothetical protein